MCHGLVATLSSSRSLHSADSLFVLVTGLSSGPRTKCPTELWPRWSGGAVLASQGATVRRVSSLAMPLSLWSSCLELGFVPYYALHPLNTATNHLFPSLPIVIWVSHTSSERWPWKTDHSECLQTGLNRKGERNKEKGIRDDLFRDVLMLGIPVVFRKCAFSFLCVILSLSLLSPSVAVSNKSWCLDGSFWTFYACKIWT